MKRLLVFGVFFLLMITVSTNYAYAASVYLNTSDSDLNVGDEFTVSVVVNDMNAATLTARVIADMSKVEFVSGPDNSNFSNGRAIYSWTDSTGGDNPIGSGMIATFYFRAISEGTANFGISGEFYDPDEDEIDCSYAGTSVRITDVTVEVNDDNNENGYDNNEDEYYSENELLEEELPQQVPEETVMQDTNKLDEGMTENEQNNINEEINESSINNTAIVEENNNTVTNSIVNEVLNNTIQNNILRHNTVKNDSIDNKNNTMIKIGAVGIIVVMLIAGVVVIMYIIFSKKNNDGQY